MGKKKKIEIVGRVLEVLPGYKFRVEIQGGNIIAASPGGKIRMFNIRIMVGDYVKMELSPYDLTQGRVTFRYNKIPKEVLINNSPEGRKDES